MPILRRARRPFLHRTHTHQLITRSERAARGGIVVGSCVTFASRRQPLTGRANRITNGPRCSWKARRPPLVRRAALRPLLRARRQTPTRLIRRRAASRNRAGGGRDRDAPEPSDVHPGAATRLWLHRQGSTICSSRPGPR